MNYLNNGALPQTPVHSFLYKKERNQEKVSPFEEFRAVLRQASRELMKTRPDLSGLKHSLTLLPSGLPHHLNSSKGDTSLNQL
jgi:hypothetical protein